MLDSVIQVIAAAGGVACFAICYNVRGKKLLFTTIGGGFSWIIFLVLNSFITSEAICYLIVSGLITIYSEILARALKTPTTTFVIPSLIPLIPGSSLYYTIASALTGEMDVFSDKLFHTLKLAAALALGIILVSAFMRMLLRIKTKNNA